jgi:hypothetical protein
MRAMVVEVGPEVEQLVLEFEPVKKRRMFRRLLEKPCRRWTAGLW